MQSVVIGAESQDGTELQGDSASGAPVYYAMRAACADCGGTEGVVVEKGTQDTVRCLCGKFQYNASRVETGKAVRTVSTVHEAISTKQRARVIIRGGCRCELCGKDPRDTRAELHVGHVVSVKRGIEMGLATSEINDDENLVAACSECNLGLGQESLPVRFIVMVLMARLRRKGATAK